MLDLLTRWKLLLPVADASSSMPMALKESLSREETAGLSYVFWGRSFVLGLLALWIGFTLPIDRSSLYLSAIGVFLLFGAAPYLLARRGVGGTALIATFLLLDAAVLSYLLIVPNPYNLEGWSPQLNLRAPGFLYLGVFLVAMALSYKPALVVWAGIATIATWSAGYLWVLSLPETLFFSSRQVLDKGLGIDEVLNTVLDPNAVGLARLTNQIVFLVLVTAILTLTVWRSRRLVRKQVAAEAQRLSLSRYFSPNIVRELSSNESALQRPKVQPAAVLFADIVGFTTISERLDPKSLVDLLRGFHGRMAQAALAHDGTVDKYIGDAIMVHFGTPHRKVDDPVRALACARDMMAEVKRWNSERENANESPIRVGIGVHYGEVIVGNIGDERRLEYTVLGDTVNVASRLEHLTREVGAQLVVSQELIAAARSCGIEPNTILPDLRHDESRSVSGRRKPVEVWSAGNL
ncbi:MAG: adenylate/guanylate cyclase domain-containing protein, partial [Pseudomonadota bacterium]